MSKKAQVFHDVSEAINLDSSGYQEAAFAKYLQSLHSLTSILLEELSSNGYETMVTSGKTEVRKLLSVISSCADRAKSALDTNSSQCNLNVHLDENTSLGNNNAGGNEIVASKSSCDFDELKATFESSYSYKIPSIRYPILERMVKDNALLLRKYQNGIASAKDKYTQHNMQLELQRRLAENTAIARSKHTQILKKAQSNRRDALESAMRKLQSNRESLTEIERETCDLFLEVLQYETKQPLLHWELVKSATEKFAVIQERTLLCNFHPLTQRLIMVKTQLEKKLTNTLEDFEEYKQLLPGPVLQNEDGASNHPITEKFSELKQDHKLHDLGKVVEFSAQIVRSTIDNNIQILRFVYKDGGLTDEVDSLFYKFMENMLLHNMWPTIVRTFRISNLHSEKKMCYIMQSYQKCSLQEFGVSSCDILTNFSELVCTSLQQLASLPSLVSIDEKLTILMSVSKQLCEQGEGMGHKKVLGADELLPILAYVLLQCGLPHLLSELQLLELFINPRYMLGVEGYVLATFLTAFKFLEFKKGDVAL